MNMAAFFSGGGRRDSSPSAGFKPKLAVTPDLYSRKTGQSVRFPEEEKMEPKIELSEQLESIPGMRGALEAFVAAGKPDPQSFPNGSSYMDWSLPFREWEAVTTGDLTVIGCYGGYVTVKRRSDDLASPRYDRVYGGPGASLGVYFHNKDLTVLRFR